MAYTQKDIDAVERAIATGTLRVTINGKTVEYRSLDELLRVRDLMRRESGQGSTTSSRRLAVFRKGT